MGAERFLLASALRLIEAQRLVRRLCSKCKEKYALDPETAAKWRLDPQGEYYRAKGCLICRGSGYQGRVGLFEVIPIQATLRDMIGESRTLPELRTEARRQGQMLLIDAGIEKVREGITSLEEVLSTCMAESEDEARPKEPAEANDAQDQGGPEKQR